MIWDNTPIISLLSCSNILACTRKSLFLYKLNELFISRSEYLLDKLKAFSNERKTLTRQIMFLRLLPMLEVASVVAFT